MKTPIVVLVVEDMPSFHRPIKEALMASGLVSEVIVVEELQQAVPTFERIKATVGAVLMDACIHRDEPDTLGVTRHIRTNFSGPMIAMSRDRGYRREQMEAGCNHESPKHDAAGYLIKLLNAPESPTPTVSGT